jgi:hypothetical protein
MAGKPVKSNLPAKKQSRCPYLQPLKKHPIRTSEAKQLEFLLLPVEHFGNCPGADRTYHLRSGFIFLAVGVSIIVLVAVICFATRNVKLESSN